MQLCETTTITKLLREGQLSVRSFNVCSKYKLRTIGEICNYFNSHGDFFGLRNIGERSNYELSELCNRFFSIPQKDTSGQQLELIGYFQQEHPIILKFTSLSIERKELAERIYRSLKIHLSVRATNALSLFCQDDSLEIFLNRLKEINFELNSLKNVGQKTVEELKHFIDNLNESIESDSLDAEATKANLETLLYQLNEVVGEISIDCQNFIIKNFLSLDKGEFPLVQFLDIVLKETQIVRSKYRLILLELSGFYKQRTTPSLEDCASVIGVTKERVRQLLYRDQIHLKSIDKIKSALELLKSFGVQMPSAFILQNSKPFYSNFDFISKDTPFTDLFFAHLLSTLHPNFLNVSFDVEEKSRPILLNKEVLENVDVIELCKKILEITSERVEEDFQVNIEGFISLYLKQDISWKQKEELTLAVEDLIGDLYGFYADEHKVLTVKRTTKKKVWEYIYEILKETGQPMHIAAISAEMNKKGFEFDPSNVRSHTLRNDSIFIVAGNSTYGLKEWEIEGKIVGGTIKQIIVKYLASFDEPKHLYEIAKHVMQQRDTTVHSIHGIIQADTLNVFQSFGEYFIGLANKSYDLSKFIITPVSNHWFKEVKKLFSKGNTSLPKKKVVQFVSSLYGVRQTQVEYVIYERVRKGGLVEKNELLVLNESN